MLCEVQTNWWDGPNSLDLFIEKKIKIKTGLTLMVESRLGYHTMSTRK